MTPGRARESGARRAAGTGGAPRLAERGFTLVELLVGTTILLVVVTGVFTSFSLGLDVRQRLRARTAELQTVRRLAALVRDDLRNLGPVEPNLAVEDQGISLLRRPRPHETEDASRVPAPNEAPPWLLRVRYRWVEEDGEPRLRREESAVARTADPPAATAMLGYETRDGEAFAAWIRGADLPADHVAHDFPDVRVFVSEVSRFDGGALVESTPGIQEAPASVSFSLDTGSSGPEETFDWEFAVWLPPAPAPEAVP